MTNFGLLFSFRNPPGSGRSFASLYAEELRQVQRAEELGYDTVWLSEHHFTEDGYSPSVLPIAAALAARTNRIRIGTFVATTSFNHAIRWAEDAAVVDIISGGRFDAGLGQGYVADEFTGFGVPREERLSRFREFLDVLQGLWTRHPFSFSGRHYTIDGADLMPPPVQHPHPPIWVGARAPHAIERIAAAGFHFMGASASVADQQLYDDALRRHGRDPANHHSAQLSWVHVAETDDQAWQNAAHAYSYLLGGYGQMTSAAADFEADRTITQPAPADIRAEFERQRAAGEPLLLEPVFGAPETVAERLRQRNAELRTTHMVLAMHLPGLDPRHAERSMELFATKVKPTLQAGR